MQQLDLHSNMFLLILESPVKSLTEAKDLHSNMFLLIPNNADTFSLAEEIYIPICFY